MLFNGNGAVCCHSRISAKKKNTPFPLKSIGRIKVRCHCTLSVVLWVDMKSYLQWISSKIPKRSAKANKTKQELNLFKKNLKTRCDWNWKQKVKMKWKCINSLSAKNDFPDCYSMSYGAKIDFPDFLTFLVQKIKKKYIFFSVLFLLISRLPGNPGDFQRI